MGVITHKGVDYPVTDAWHAANNGPFPTLAGETREALRNIQDQLLQASNSRALTDDELATLKAANNHFDVRTSIDWLAGRDIADFGFTGVDQVHGGAGSFDCGCRLRTVFDHVVATADDASGLVINPHYPRAVCTTHAPPDTLALALANQPYPAATLASLHEQVLADNATGS